MLKTRLPLMAILAGLVLAGSVLGPGSGNVTDASHGGGMDAMSIDLVTTGNTATSLGTLDSCIEVAPGASFDIDVTATNIPASHRMIAFAFSLEYFGGLATVNTNSISFLIGANAGSAPMNAGDSTPDSDGTFSGAAYDSGPIPGSSESGSGVLARMNVTAPLSYGFYPLTLATTLHIDTASVVYPPDIVNNASIAVSPATCAYVPPVKNVFKIAFRTDRDGDNEIYSMNGDGTNAIRLTTSPGDDLQPAWSADGTKIAFISFRDGNFEIYTMNADGTSQTNRTSNAAGDFGPVWSPDGTKLAFWTERDGNNEIYVMNADGSGQTNLTNDAGSDAWPTWSADGTKIAFISPRSGNHEVYVMNADGSGQTNVSNNAAYEDFPSWSPDGTKIAFVSSRDGDAEIFKMHADGSSQTQLTFNTAHDIRPRWKAGSEQIVFDSNLTSDNEIFSIMADGSGQTNLSNSPASSDMEADWRRVSGGGSVDYDGDGCPDSRENGTSQTTGGLRNPQNPYDYFNPSGDGLNRVDDILAIVDEYFIDVPDINPPAGVGPEDADLSSLTDRTYVGPNPWNLGPPNGLQRVDDILNQVKQYFHDCS